MTSVSQTTQQTVVGWLVSNDLQRMQAEATVAASARRHWAKLWKTLRRVCVLAEFRRGNLSNWCQMRYRIIGLVRWQLLLRSREIKTHCKHNEDMLSFKAGCSTMLQENSCSCSSHRKLFQWRFIHFTSGGLPHQIKHLSQVYKILRHETVHFVHFLYFSYCLDGSFSDDTN
jgi:hypothetical protein